VTSRTAILHSIPVAAGTEDLVGFLRPFGPARLVYLSTTGVYGSAERVDEHTPPNPGTERDVARMEVENLLSFKEQAQDGRGVNRPAEKASEFLFSLAARSRALCASGPWSTLILRPAAIYGPGRGVHWSARQGVFRPAPGGNRVISRIHVDDLAEHALRGLQSDITGAFPVADEEPCPSLEVAEWTCRYIGMPSAARDLDAAWRNEQTKGRRVDGSAVRAALGVELQYRSFREGVPACLAAENALAGGVIARLPAAER
jgi:nucleoside-diphosphate-sugar epimerase